MHLGGKKFCAGAFFTAGLAMLASGLTNAEPRWPQYGFNARHTLFNPSEQILNRSNVAALSLRWEYTTGNGTGIAPLGGAALADGVLYVPSYAQTTFMAFDAETGASLWTYIGLGTFSDPAVWRGHVYTASLDGNLYAFPTNCVGTFAPAVSDDQVFVSGDRGVYAFPASCATPCAPLWVASTQFSPAAAPTVADGFVLVADYQGTVYAFDSATGNLKWRGTVAAIPHAIAAAHGVAYLSSGNGELVAFAVAGCGQTVCNPLWTSAPSGLSLFTPTIANGVVYVGALDFIYTQGDILAYPTVCTDGCQPLATLVLGGANETPIAVAGGRVYATR